MKQIFTFVILFIFSINFATAQCEPPMVVNWNAVDSATFNIDFLASENSSGYIVNFVALYDESDQLIDPLVLTYTGTSVAGVNAISHNPSVLLISTYSNFDYINTYFYKVELATICDGDTVWGDDFYMSQNSLLNNENFECPENLFMPFTFLPDGQGEVYETIFEVEEGDTPVQIDEFAILVDLGHTYLGDLSISLTSPNGTTILLLDQNGIGLGGAHNFSVLFQEGAADMGTTTTFGGVSTVHGIYAPAESFSSFVGENLSGTWILTIADLLAADNGFVYGVCLSVETSPCTSSLSGTAYFDANNNNTFDDNEYPYVFGMVSSLEDNYRFTNEEGDYLYCLPNGLNEIQMENIPLYHTIVPENYTVDMIAGDYLDGYDFALQQIQGMEDLSIELFHVTPDRPGFENTYYINYTNLGTECIDDVSILFTADDLVEILGIEGAGEIMINGSTATIELGTVCPYESGSFVITILVDETTEIGTNINYTAVISPTAGDENTLDNYAHDFSEVVGSYDPNDITVDYSIIDEDYLTEEKSLEYIIRFQNTGNYYAEDVIVTNTIDEDLLLGTLEILDASHDVETSVINGEVRFEFANILLAASEDDYDGSQGYVRYRIQPNSSFSYDDVIENVANIYFDFNEAIVTNTATTVLGEMVSVSEISNLSYSIYPNPSNGLFYIDVLNNNVDYYEIYNLVGELVQSDKIHGNSIDAQSLSGGAYTLKVLDKNYNYLGSSIVVRK